MDVKSEEAVEGLVIPRIFTNGPEVEDELEEEEEELVDVEVEVDVEVPKSNMVYAFRRKESPNKRSNPAPAKLELAE